MSFSNEHREQHPKKIILNVGPSGFEQISAGLKTLEMRLKKEGRIKINVGDILLFKLFTGQEQKAEDEMTLERKVIDIRTHLGISEVLEKENYSAILPNRSSKEEFLNKITGHYQKVAKKLDIEECEFEIIEFTDKF